MSIEYMRSKKFFAADGGWNRIVWIPKEVKEKVKDFIPADVVDKVATEEDAKNIDELKAFLKAKNHPVVAKWEAEAAPAAETSAIQINEEAAGTMMPSAAAGRPKVGWRWQPSPLPVAAGARPSADSADPTRSRSR